MGRAVKVPVAVGVVSILVVGGFVAGQLVEQWVTEVGDGTVDAWSEMGSYTLLQTVRRLKDDDKWLGAVALGVASVVWPYLKILVAWTLLTLCSCSPARAPAVLPAARWIEFLGRWAMAITMLVLVITVTLDVTLEASELTGLRASDLTAYFPVHIRVTPQNGAWIFAAACCTSLLLGSVVLDFIEGMHPRKYKIAPGPVEFWLVLVLMVVGAGALGAGIALPLVQTEYSVLGAAKPARDWSLLELLKDGFTLRREPHTEGVGQAFLTFMVMVGTVLAPVFWLVCCILLWCGRGARWGMLFPLRSGLGRWCSVDVLLLSCGLVVPEVTKLLASQFSSAGLDSYLRGLGAGSATMLNTVTASTEPVLPALTTRATKVDVKMLKGFWVLLGFAVWSYLLSLWLDLRTSEHEHSQPSGETLPLLSGEASKQQAHGDLEKQPQSEQISQQSRAGPTDGQAGAAESKAADSGNSDSAGASGAVPVPFSGPSSSGQEPNGKEKEKDKEPRCCG